MDDSQLKNIVQNIQHSLAEISSEKISNRHKYIEILNTTLSHQRSEIVLILKNANSFDLSWSDIFVSVMNSVMKHTAKLEESKHAKNYQTIQNKNPIYHAVTSKIMEYGTEANIVFPISTILERFFTGFSSKTIIKHFGSLLLQILENTVFHNSSNFSKITIREFSRLISHLFEGFKIENSNFSSHILKCLNKTIDVGKDFLQISIELNNFLSDMEKVCLTSCDERHNNEIIKLAYTFVQQISVDFHQNACKFLQNVLANIFSFYNFRMRSEIKEIFFNLCNISIVLHYPNISSGEIYSPINIDEPNEWIKIFRQMFSIVKNEILRSISAGKSESPSISENFIELTSRLSYLICWKNILKDISDYSKRKIPKKNEKIDAVLECVEETGAELNWVWFSVLNKLLTYNFIQLNSVEYNDIMEMANLSINQVQFPYQLEILTKFCEAILNQDLKSQQVSVPFDMKFWEKVWNLASSDSIQDDKLSNGKNYLLQVLLKDKRVATENAVSSLTQSIISKPFKNNVVLETFKILLIFHGNYLLKSENLTKEIIAWLFPKKDIFSDRYSNSETPNLDEDKTNLIAEVSVLLVTKIKIKEVVNSSQKQLRKNELTSELENYLSFKYLQKLLCFECRKDSDPIVLKTDPSLSIVSLNETYLEILLKAMNLDLCEAGSTASQTEKLIINVIKLEKAVVLMNKFLRIGIKNCKKQLVPLTKKISFLLNTIDIDIQSVLTSSFNLTDLQMFTHKLEEIFINLDQCKNSNSIGEVDLSHVIIFIGECIDKWRHSTCFEEIENVEKLRSHCLHAIAVYDRTKSIGNEFHAYIKKYYDSKTINSEDEVKLFFEISQKYYERPTRIEVAEWMAEELSGICSKHHTNKNISEMVVSHLPDILNYVKYNADLVYGICIILSSFLKKCFKNSYSVDLTIKTLLTLKNVIKIYPDALKDEGFLDILAGTCKFISSRCLKIEFSAIELFGYLIDSNWGFSDKTIPVEYFHFCNKMYNSLNLDVRTNQTVKEMLDNETCVKVQLLMTVIYLCPFLRQRCFMNLLNLSTSYLSSQLNFSKIYNLPSLPVPEDLIELMALDTLKKNRPIKEIPWYLCYAEEKQFYKENFEILAFCILQTSSSDLQNLADEIDIHLGDILDAAIPIYYAFNLPKLAKVSVENNEEYYSRINFLNQNLKKFVNGSHIKAIVEKDLWKVLHHLFQYFWDEKKLEEYFGFNFLHKNERLILNFDSMKDCLQMLLKLNLTCKEKSIKGLLINEADQIIKLGSAIKVLFEKTPFVEGKLIQIFRYCALIEIILESLSLNSESNDLEKTMNFFIKDVICFFGNILKDDNCPVLLKVASLFYVRKFSKTVLRVHSVALGCCLKVFVRQIVNLIEDCTNSEILENCFETLNVLICESCDILGEFIGGLDDFPASERFTRFNEIKEKFRKEITSNQLKDHLGEFVSHVDRNVEEFKNLKMNMSRMKPDLVEMCENIPANCEDHVLHRTITVLLDAIRSEKYNIALEASKCLGEIGPVDLRTIALNNSCGLITYKPVKTLEESLDYFVQCVAKSLANLIFSQNQEVCALSADVCIIVANTRTGSSLKDEYEFLHPFISGKFATKESIEIKVERTNLDLNKILDDAKLFPYEKWMKFFTSNIYNYLGWMYFEKLALKDVSFCEASLVPLIKILLTRDNSENITSLEDTVNYFFEQTSTALSQEDANTKTYTSYKNKSIIKVFLNISECIRIYKQSLNVIYSVNCLHIAKACAYCEAYFMAILYLELWGYQDKESENSTQNKLIENPIFQDVARESYKSIGITVAIEGFLNPITSRLEYLSNQNNWTEVLLTLDATNSQISSATHVSYLKWNGLFSLISQTQKPNEVDYETCWRLGEWDKFNENAMDLDKFNITSEAVVEFHHFQALKAVNKKNQDIVIDSIENGRKNIISLLKNVSTECTQTVYKYLFWLQLFQHIEDFYEIQFQTNSEAESLLEKWDQQDKIAFGNNSYKEIAISQKLCLIQSAGIRAQRKINNCSKGKDIVGEYMLRAITACKDAEKQNLAIRHIAHLKELNVSNDIKVSALIEDAIMNWNSSNTEVSKAVLYHILSKEEFGICTNKVDALRIYGEILAETNSESFDLVREKFFKAALALLENFSNHRELILKKFPNKRNLVEFDKFYTSSRRDVLQRIAKYADREYIQTTDYINSDAFKTKLRIIKEIKETINREKSGQIKDRDKQITLNIMLKNTGIDDNEVKFVEEKRTEYLCLAVVNYIRCCILEDTIETINLYRILALWFSNKSNPNLRKEIEENIFEIPSYKFICVLDQITTRLGSSHPEFLNIVKKILVTCMREHPHHTLPKLLALKNVNEDGNSKSSPNDSRCLTVKQILQEIKSEETNCFNSMIQLQQVFIALIKFSNKEFSMSDRSKNNNNFAISDELRKLRNLKYVQCLTLELPISRNGDYSNIKSIYKWNDVFSLVGGINAPKRLICICSDGIARPQLLKGKDDLRQDAVMMQALQIVNNLLNSNKRGNFNIRTYKVVPLSKRSGILEWCENTIPFGLYLTGPNKKGGAHKKYRPEDLLAADCRARMASVAQSSFEDKLKVFKDICEKIKPVFHHFFFENFLNPGLWFQRRQSYINSVAATSMVGYVLGLGDRHTQNILVDKKTAELIHIDFGIAFEQGKVMPTPETVPFRLTRDIVDPMGVSGVEGIFRQRCEQVMIVLRKNSNVLMTILEVLLYDPLYSWIVDNRKILKSQEIEINEINDDLEGKNATAQRALLRVKSKLDGMDETGTGVANVDVQVRRLIKQAMSSKNLCRLFSGWEPYL